MKPEMAATLGAAPVTIGEAVLAGRLREPAAPPPFALARQFVAEWLALLLGLGIAGALIGYTLINLHRAVDTSERDRLRVQARVVEENVGTHLDGIHLAMDGVRNELLAIQPGRNAAVLFSPRLKALSDAIPSVRSMVLLDADGNVIASSVDALLGRDFSDRDYFREPRARRDPALLHVAAPYKTSLGTYTVMFGRAVVAGDGSFAGVVVAALEPEYFEVLMRSVLYAPDMWVSLGHGDGKVFVTMPREPRRVEADWQADAAARADASPATAARILLGAAGGSTERRLTALASVSPPSLQMDKPLVIAVSRSEDEVFAPWRKQALDYSLFFALLTVAAAIGLHRGQWRRRAFALLAADAARERQRHAEQLELALEGADLGLWDWELRDDRFRHNGVMRKHLGYPSGQTNELGSDWRSLIHPADSGRVVAMLEAHFRRETPAYECEFRFRHQDGRWVWLLSRGKVVERDQYDIPVRMAGTHMDLSERKQTQMQLERSADMLRRTGELAQIGGWELDLASMRVAWTEEVYRIHELEPGEMPSLQEALSFYAPPGRPFIEAAIDASIAHGTPWDLELPFITAKGNPRWVRAQGVAVREDGRAVRLVGAFQDITEKKTISLELQRLNEQLTRLSRTDPLTEIGNRRLFDQTLKAEWARAARRSEPVALLMIDIDHFKEYNDHYGHPSGDACLRQVARMVGEAVRRGGELVARYGGEEFALLLPGADLESALHTAERCRQRVADAKIEHRASETSAWLSVSIGVASQVAAAGVDCNILVEIADAALYRAKRCGRGRIEH